ncbi:hypothetical protein [Asticcacaulis machinosus]|uniref:Flap endonuclease-1-like 5' DNA nuclease n=1 Tax=Asticcacaulis machinosus TaxID=2984211 RepID=A0ABT5HGJ7_9CAUL|nr:hypothetical protein [Asticcacaulis machinosus]MDC7675113.1 hypothetical protein [Asticcacaulis machinosus]
MQVMMLQAAVLCLIGFALGGGIGWLVGGLDKATQKTGQTTGQKAGKSQPVAKPFVAHNWDWETPAKAEPEMQIVAEPVAEPVRAAAPVVALFEAPSAAQVFEQQVSTPVASPTSVPEVAVETEVAYEDRSDRARIATPVSTLAVMTPDSVEAAVVQAGTGLEPMRLSTSQGHADDLHIISGISPALEKTLNVLGIYHFWQVASWTPENVAWLAHRIDNGDRIARENWMAQAARLQQSRLAKLA